MSEMAVMVGIGVLFAAVAAVTSEAALLVSMLVGQAILSARHAGASLADPGALRAMIGAGLYLTVTGLFGIALGFLLRNTAGAIVSDSTLRACAGSGSPPEPGRRGPHRTRLQSHPR